MPHQDPPPSARLAPGSFWTAESEDLGNHPCMVAVAEFLDAREVCRLASTCRPLYGLLLPPLAGQHHAADELVWRPLVIRQFEHKGWASCSGATIRPTGRIPTWHGVARCACNVLAGRGYEVRLTATAGADGDEDGWSSSQETWGGQTDDGMETEEIDSDDDDDLVYDDDDEREESEDAEGPSREEDRVGGRPYRDNPFAEWRRTVRDPFLAWARIARVHARRLRDPNWEAMKAAEEPWLREVISGPWVSSGDGLVVGPCYDAASGRETFKVWDARQNDRCVRALEGTRLHCQGFNFAGGVLAGVATLRDGGQRRTVVMCYHDLGSPDPNAAIVSADVEIPAAVAQCTHGGTTIDEGDCPYYSEVRGINANSANAVHLVVDVRIEDGGGLSKSIGMLVLRLWKSSNVLEPVALVDCLGGGGWVQEAAVVGRFLFVCRANGDRQPWELCAVDMAEGKTLWTVEAIVGYPGIGGLAGPDPDLGMVGYTQAPVSAKAGFFLDFSGRAPSAWHGDNMSMTKRIADLMEAIPRIPSILDGARQRLIADAADRPDLTLYVSNRNAAKHDDQLRGEEDEGCLSAYEQACLLIYLECQLGRLGSYYYPRVILRHLSNGMEKD